MVVAKGPLELFAAVEAASDEHVGGASALAPELVEIDDVRTHG